MEYMIKTNHVCKEYHVGQTTIKANDNIDLQIDKDEFCVIVGPSGSGKTTLLNLLGGMDIPTSGEIVVDGVDISKYNDKQLTLYRRNSIGFVFQFYNLMSNLTALDNVEIASEICSSPLNGKDVLKQVGLEDRMDNFPSQLSGGEQQRVSIARAIAKNPKILLCDEPTGALDYQTGKRILRLLHDLCKNLKKTVIVITHNSAITPMADHVVYVKNGTIVKEEYNEKPLPIESIEW